MMMALGGMRDLPSVLVPGGVTLPPDATAKTRARSRRIGARFSHGLITLEKAADLGCRACASPGGGCQFLGTAATSQVVGEALGLALPHSALAPSGQPVWLDIARSRRAALAQLRNARITKSATFSPTRRSATRWSSTRRSAARRICCCTSPPSPTPRAAAADRRRLDRRQPPASAPRRCAAERSGRHHPTVRVFLAGGVPEVMLHLRALGLLDLDVLTVTRPDARRESRLVGDDASGARASATCCASRTASIRDDVIMSPGRAPERGLTEHGDFPARQSRARGLRHQEHRDRSERGRCRWRLSQGPARRASSPARTCGHRRDQETGRHPAGRRDRAAAASARWAPAWRRPIRSRRRSSICPSANTSRCSPTRVSRGVSTGACIGHVGPEALAGGPIGKLRDGDRIRIVIDRADWRAASTSSAKVTALRAGRCGENPAPQPARRAPICAPPRLPDDTRLWAALQQVSGGTWGGCVYDVDEIVERLTQRP